MVNRQVCVIMTPLAADQLATRLLAPKPVAPRGETDVNARHESSHAEASGFAVDVRDLLPPLLRQEARPIVRVDPPPVIVSDFVADLRAQLPAMVFEDLPPAGIATSEVALSKPDLLDDLPPFGFEDPSPSDLDNLPPFVHPDVRQVDSELAAVEPESGESSPSRDREDRRPEWIRRVEGAVRDELDWYRSRH